MSTIYTGIVRFFDLPFVDVLIQKRKAIVRQSYVSADSTYISYGSRALSVRSPYTFLYKTQGGRTVVVGSPQTVSGYRTESLGLLTDALVTFGLRLACDDRTMPFFAFSCGLRRVTL